MNNRIKKLKETTMFQIVMGVGGLKNYSNRFFTTKREADEYGELYLNCGYITNYFSFPVKKTWLMVK